MKSFYCILTLFGLAGCLPFDRDMTAGLRVGTPLDEGELIEGDIITLGGSAKNLVRKSTQLWPNKVYPYKFGNGFNSLEKFNIETAIRDLASQTCVQFRERTNEPTYAVFMSYAKVCATLVGYMDLSDLGNEMPVYVSVPGCELRGQIQHEILHSLGFWHEHSRPDRDQYITVNWDNIEPGSERNFDPRSWDDSQTMNLPYDLGSVMHYSENAFSRDGSPTLTPIDSSKRRNMGQRFRVSKLDIAKLNRLYDCDDRYYRGNDVLP